MPDFDDAFYDNLSKVDVSFSEYFKTVGGKDIRINYMTNEMYIMGVDQIHQGTIRLGRSAKNAGLELSKLLKTEHQVGDYNFGVLLNGYNNKDWLFAVKVVAIL